MNNCEVDFYIKSLPQEEILCFLNETNKAHYKKLSDIVDLDAYAKKLSEKATHFTLYDEEKLIGFCPCYFNDDMSKVGYISGISFLEEYRCLGLGGKLLQHIIEYGKENHFKEISVNPDCKNTVLIHFFIKNGFDRYGKSEDRCLLKHIIKENV